MDIQPLATHLEPKFGNFYHYGSWTVELKAAVRHYIIDVAPEDLYKSFLDLHEVPPGTRAEQADFILNDPPWYVGAGFHFAAVATIPTFDQLIDQIKTNPTAIDTEDIALWMKEHATEMQIIRMVQDSGQLQEIFNQAWYSKPNSLALELVKAVPLPKLRKLWDRVSRVR